MKKTIFKIMSLALTVALLASLIVGVMPAGALTIVTASGNSETISTTDVTYDITFTGALNLVIGDTITVTFPAGFDVSDVYSASFDPGDGGGSLPASIDDSAEEAGILTFTIAEDAFVGFVWTLSFYYVTNPDVAGNYTLAVYTSKEPTAVVSPVIRIGSPGIVQYYNAAGAYLGTLPDFAELAYIGIGEGWTVKVGAGFYSLNSMLQIDNDDVTLTTTGGAMLNGEIDVDGDNFTMSGFTMIGSNICLDGNRASLSGMNFEKFNPVMAGLPPSYASGETFVEVYGEGNTITDSNFDATSPAGYQDTCIYDDGLDTTVENCTFKVDQTAAYYPDYAIDAYHADGLVVNNNKFTGSSGIGVYMYSSKW
jgi:hypothetical protein